MMRTIVLVTLALAACATPTEIIVVVPSNLDPTELTAVQLWTGDASGNTLEPRSCVCVGAMCPNAVETPLYFPLVPGTQGIAPFSVQITGHADIGCAEAQFIHNVAYPVLFESHQRLSITIDLSAECVGVVCEEQQTCENGQCVGTMKTETGNPDLTSTLSDGASGRKDAGRTGTGDGGAILPHDLGIISAPDLGLNVTMPFAVLKPVPDFWDVTAMGADFYLGWANGADDKSFYSGNVMDIAAGVLPRVRILAGSALAICATPSAIKSNSVVVDYFVGEQTGDGNGWAIYAYTSTGAPTSPAFTSPDGEIQTLSDLQCAVDGSGIFFGLAIPSNIAGQSAALNVARYDANSTTQPTLVANATNFVLSRGNYDGIMADVPEAKSGRGPTTNSTGCELMLYADWSDTTPNSTSCLSNESGAYALASNAASYYDAFYASSMSGAFVGDVPPAGATTISVQPVQAAMIATTMASALAMIDATGVLWIAEVGSTTASIPKKITTGADSSKPVKIAYVAGSALVLWVDQMSQNLMGVVLTQN